jgi:hypothetical protein
VKENTKKERDEILTKEKQFQSAAESWSALRRNDEALSKTKASIAPNPRPEAMDEDTILDNSVGIHPPAPVVPQHMCQNFPRNEEYWEGHLLDDTDTSDLLQDAPAEIPFAELRSAAANAAVSTVKQYCHLRKSRSYTARTGKHGRLPSFHHISGNVQCKSRFPLEDAGLFGAMIMTDEHREKFLRLKQEELVCVQQCNKWLREHNIWSRVYRSNWELLQKATGPCAVDSELLPVADSEDLLLSNHVRASTALGDNAVMLASVDLSQYRGQYRNLAETLDGVGAVAARSLNHLSQVSVRDINLDAKTFAILYPHGTGSLNSIENCVDGNTYAKQLMFDLGGGFRNSDLWAAQQQDRKLKKIPAKA